MSFFEPGGMLGSLTAPFKSKEEDIVSYLELSTTTVVTQTSESSEDQKFLDSTMVFGPESIASEIQSKYRLQILGISSNGARTRTETQIKLILRITLSNSMESPCCDWKWLQLPQHLFHPSSTLKGKTIEELKARSNPLNTLYVKVRILKSDNSREQIYSCLSCVLREKRRKSSKKRTLSHSSSSASSSFPSSPDWIFLNETSSPSALTAQSSLLHSPLHHQEEEEREGIIIFAGSSHLLQVLDGEVMIPCRLTCYCRHHNEPVGFRIAIDLYDFKNHLICSSISPTIMVTDDHKKNGTSALTVSPTSSMIYNGNNIGLGAGNSMSLSPNSNFSMISPKNAMMNLATILKVVPAEGPMYGGVEITALGHNFTNESVLYFGNAPASMVMLISSNTMIVRLPPSLLPGIVPVTIGNPNNITSSSGGGGNGSINANSFPMNLSSASMIINPQSILPSDPQNPISVLFNYKNDLDRAMMELALQLIGMKLTGRVDDARDVAMRIIQENTMALPSSPVSIIESNHVDDHMGSNLPNATFISSETSSIERTLIAGLTATEMHMGVDFSAKNFLQFRTMGGHTLLHLAAFGKYKKLFEYLASFDDVIINAIDNNGFTASNFAYLQGMDTLLESLGLEEDDDENNYDLVGVDRLTHLCSILKKKRQNQCIKTKMGNWIKNFLKRPQRLRGQFQRLRTGLWRKYFPSNSVKPFYYKRLERRSSQSSVLTNNTNVSVSSTPLSYLNQILVRCKRIVFVYFWIPVIVAVIVAWIWRFIMTANQVHIMGRLIKVF